VTKITSDMSVFDLFLPLKYGIMETKKGKKMKTYKIGKYSPGQFVWGRWSEASVWWTYRGGASSRVPFV